MKVKVRMEACSIALRAGFFTCYCVSDVPLQIIPGKNFVENPHIFPGTGTRIMFMTRLKKRFTALNASVWPLICVIL